MPCWRLPERATSRKPLKYLYEHINYNCFYRWTDINVRELIDALLYPGFRKLAIKFLAAGIKETSRSFITSLQVRQLQKFIPTITTKDVKKGPAGVRAQALDLKGNLVDDFYFDMMKKSNTEIGSRILHCRNAPSPGATSSLAIARMMSEKIEKEFNLTPEDTNVPC